MNNSFLCPRCGNDNPKYVGYLNGKPYCRRCIGFTGEEAENFLPRPKTVGFQISYSLSKEQEALSKQIIENFKQGIDTLIYAVCGSGKTEISYGVIAYAMSKGLHVGFALPRRDVVIELYARIQSAFPTNRVVAVYGGHSEILEGDCIVLTTHQLYRYPQFFDLLILDEIDAFPFKDNEVLQAFFEKSLKGHYVMMSATPSKAVVDRFRGKGKMMLSLHTRFHKHPIPVPKTEIKLFVFKFLFLIRTLKRFRKEKKPCLVFVPTIEESLSLYRVLKPFVSGGGYVNSKHPKRNEVIGNFKKGKYAYLISTAVLERGVTIANCQVIVFQSDSKLYDAAALIQIAGRAGRKSNAPNGEVLFIAERESEGMLRAIEEIRYCNKYLQTMHETSKA